MTDGGSDGSGEPEFDWLDAMPTVAAEAPLREKGSYFEAFAEGDVVRHAPGLRLTRDGNDLWTSQTLNHDPAYWRPDVARERGFDEPPVHPDYLVACTMGPSVEDLSEKGGYFLGRTDVRFHRDAVYAGTDLRVESEVVETRTSSSRPAYGIVTWETTSYDLASDDPLCSYGRTNMIPRRTPVETDGGRAAEGDGDQHREATLERSSPGEFEFVVPDGPFFEDFAEALDRADARGGGGTDCAGRSSAVLYRHERGRTVDDALTSVLPLRTLNTAKQHHNADVMADSPSGEPVVYGDVTRSIALGHARSDEATYREESFVDERFHDFVTTGDTVYAVTRVLEAESVDDATGRVRFVHYAVNQDGTAVYSGTRTARIRRRGE